MAARSLPGALAPMRIALCEAGDIEPTRDAGSRAVADLRDGLAALGHEVRLLTEVAGSLPEAVAAMRPDLIIISRPGLFIRLEPAVRPLGTPIVYFAHDLHFVRIGLQNANDGGDRRSSAVLRFVERTCFESADLSLVPTAEEADTVAREFPRARCTSVDYFSMPTQPLPAAPPATGDLVFVGGAFHEPNRAGMHWFLEQVWPSHLERNPESRLTVCGEWEAPPRAPGRVDFVGRLTDPELDRVLGAARAGIAPLLFGAGMKRKTLHYLSHGLPVVGTSFAVEGLRSPDGSVPGFLEASTPGEWVAALDELADDGLWSALSRSGSRFVRERFSAASYRAQLARALRVVS